MRGNPKVSEKQERWVIEPGEQRGKENSGESSLSLQMG